MHCASGTDCYIKNIKVEEGTSATPWMPELPASLICADSSGYAHTTTITSNLLSASDSGRYTQSVSFPGSNSYIKVNENGWMAEYTEGLTVSVWAKTSNWATRLFSCTEDGGWNLEPGASGYVEFALNVWTNAAHSTRGYFHSLTGQTS